MGGSIEDYAQRFARLRTNRNRKVWSGVTAHQAPHKPFLLLCVLDLFDSGEITSNLVEIIVQTGPEDLLPEARQVCDL